MSEDFAYPESFLKNVGRVTVAGALLEWMAAAVVHAEKNFGTPFGESPWDSLASNTPKLRKELKALEKRHPKVPGLKDLVDGFTTFMEARNRILHSIPMLQFGKRQPDGSLVISAGMPGQWNHHHPRTGEDQELPSDASIQQLVSDAELLRSLCIRLAARVANADFLRTKDQP